MAQGTFERGRFITVEGGEGAGKSTNIAVVHKVLEEAGKKVRLTREPGGTPLAEEIRRLLLEQRPEPMCELTELLLVFAARAQHVRALIEPALARGEWVVSDRFADATLAYQGAGRGMQPRLIRELQELVLGDFRPDLTLLLDIPVSRGMGRMRVRGEPDRFEIEEEAFFERVRACYLELASVHGARFRVIDADRSPEEVERSVAEAVRCYLEACGG